jgi:hypothetical protein
MYHISTRVSQAPSLIAKEVLYFLSSATFAFTAAALLFRATIT